MTSKVPRHILPNAQVQPISTLHKSFTFPTIFESSEFGRILGPPRLFQMAQLILASLTSLRVSRHQIPAHNLLPNTSLQSKPLLIYHSCFPSSTSATSIERHLNSVGVVTPQWRYTMYSTTHFHSTTHEVLCVFAGKAKLCKYSRACEEADKFNCAGFGGEENPGRVEAMVEEGDAIVVPAGVGHRLLDDYGSGFEMVGSYPKGKSWDMCYGKRGEEEKVRNISGLRWFERDPLYGDEGPTLTV